jgi:hypothetical protein
MGIDWSNEDYARLYKRETDDDLLLSWEARAVWHEFLKRCDKGGLLETKRGVRGFAALIRIPVEVVERVLQELLEDGRLRSVPNKGFVSPNYVSANYVARSTRARQEHSRLMKRVTGSGQTGHDGSDSELSSEDHESVSRGVTSGHAVSHFSHTNQPTNQPPSARSRGRASGSRSAIHPSWEPQAKEREIALGLGLDPDAEAKEFLTYWLGDGRAKADWDQAFESRLLAQAKRRRPMSEEVRDVQDM